MAQIYEYEDGLKLIFFWIFPRKLLIYQGGCKRISSSLTSFIFFGPYLSRTHIDTPSLKKQWGERKGLL